MSDCECEKKMQLEEDVIRDPFTVGAKYRNGKGWMFGQPEELEVEVYVKVYFRIQTWDGQVREHEADLPGHVSIRHLKEELEHELGDPKLCDWVLARTNMPMSDDSIIYNTYPINHGDRINVLVHNPNARKRIDTSN